MTLGQYVEIDARPAVRFERIYSHCVERVWAAVSEPTELCQWFPSAVELEAKIGGAVCFSGDPNIAASTGRVLVFDPPHHLAFTWDDDELHLDLEALDPDRCRLVLTNVLSARDTAARNAAGWMVCLGELDTVVAGHPSDGPHSADNVRRFEPLYEQHRAAGLPSGAAIPEVS